MDVNNYELNTENTIKGLVELNDEEIKRYSVKPNDLFFTRTSETSEEIGLTSAYVGKEIKCVFSGFLLRARPKMDVNSLFFAYYFRSPKQRNNIIKFSSITTRALISGGNLSKMKIKFPNIGEQNKITKLFLILNKKIQLLEKKYQYYQDFKKYLMQQIFTQKLRFNSDGMPIENFNNNVEILGYLCKIQTGKLDANAMDKNGKYRFFTCSKKFSFIDTFAFDTEALLIAGNGEIGNVQYYNGKFNAYQRTYVLNDFVDSVSIMYVKYFLENYLPKQIWRNKQIGSMPYIVLSTLFDMKISFPPIVEQNKYVTLLLNADKKIELINNQLEYMDLFKKGLLQQMFV